MSDERKNQINKRKGMGDAKGENNTNVKDEQIQDLRAALENIKEIMNGMENVSFGVSALREEGDSDKREDSSLKYSMNDALEDLSNGSYGNGTRFIILEKMANLTDEIHKKCYDVLKECYEDQPIVLPIDIEMVAAKKGIIIEYSNLNFVDGDRIDQDIAQFRYEWEGSDIVRKIFVDNSMSGKQNIEEEALSNLEKYAVAYELGKTIFEEEIHVTKQDIFQMNAKSKPYALPRLSASLGNFGYEMCAIFLLLPMKLFLEEFASYLVEIKDHPVMMERWIKHLSEKAGIPNYQLINGYQYIKFSAYKYYKENLSREIKGKDYTSLYNC